MRKAIVTLGGWIGECPKGQLQTFDYEGAAYGLRVQAAVQLYNQTPCLVIASGGTAKFAKVLSSVARVIKDELISRGVKPADIIVEDCSYDTLDQLMEVRRIVKKKGIINARIVSNAWHLPRVKAMVKHHPLLQSLPFDFVAAEKVVGSSPDESARMKEIIRNEEHGRKQVLDETFHYGFNICERKIDRKHPVFVVAEISGNHHQNYDEAAALVKAAKDARANAVKFQTYTADTMTLDSDKEWFRVSGEDNPESWKGKTLYQLYRENCTPWDWFPKLKELAEDLGLVFFSTPFDETAVDFLEKLGVPCYKIASYEVTDIPLLEKIGSAGKPVILSVGYASMEEIELAVKTLKEAGAWKIALLHCLTNYSEGVKETEAYLGNISDLAKRFNAVSGFSDNNAGIEVPVAAVAAGACIVEKHFILDRSRGGADARFSLEPAEFKEMVKRIRETQIGSKPSNEIHYGPASPAEEYNKRFRRSIFASRNIKAGEKFTIENIRVVRPAFGLAPKHYEEILGKTAKVHIEEATPLSREMIQK